MDCPALGHSSIGNATACAQHANPTPCPAVVSTLLSLMDGLTDRGSVIVIGATNRCEGAGVRPAYALLLS